MNIVITIDGPASSGKGTISKLLAKLLDFNYLDSGAIYRSLAYACQMRKLDLEQKQQIIMLIDQIKLSFVEDKVILDQEDVTELIRDEKIGMFASKLAKDSDIRAKLLDFQRLFAKDNHLITDGRDMGSVVFPNATLKVFLTASAQSRAQRRYEQLQLSGKSAKIAGILDDIVKRDLQDSSRSVAPLRYDSSFQVLDNSNLSIKATAKQILDWLEQIIESKLGVN